MNKHQKKKPSGKRSFRILSIVSGIIALLAVTGIAVYLFTIERAQQEYAKLSEQVHIATPAPTAEPTPEPTTEPSPEPTPDPTPEPVHIPIDFASLRSVNSDVIGWIEVEGTDIDYPILYDTSETMYYLDHNYQGSYTASGSIFIQGYNQNDFTDFNTVLYGHNMASGAMFAHLHRFRQESFFDENNTIIIYTPNRKLTYEIFAAYRTDNLNIMLTQDFTTVEGREAYLDHIYSHSEMALFEQSITVTEEDRIITLSTCIGNDMYRYLVQAILISDEAGA